MCPILLPKDDDPPLGGFPHEHQPGHSCAAMTTSNAHPSFREGGEDRSSWAGAGTVPLGKDRERFLCGIPSGLWHGQDLLPRHAGWAPNLHCACGVWFDDAAEACLHLAQTQFNAAGTPRVIEVDRPRGHADDRFESVA